MPQQKIIPFTWESWDFVGGGIEYKQVVFTNNFGEFKNRETFEQLSVDWIEGKIEAYSIDSDKPIKTQYFKATPIE